MLCWRDDARPRPLDRFNRILYCGARGVLGAAARGLVGYAGYGKDAALISATAGKLNGLASMGAVLQSLLAPQLVKYLGWPGLFAVLGLAMLSAAVVLRPAVAIEAAALKKKKA